MPDVVAPVTAIADLLREIVAGLRAWIAGADIRRMKAAIEYGEEYIRTNNRSDITPEQKKKVLAVLEDKFFHYN